MENTFKVITWPKSQFLMEYEGFEVNAYLISDRLGLEKYGASSYFVSKKWLKSIKDKYKTYQIEFCKAIDIHSPTMVPLYEEVSDISMESAMVKWFKNNGDCYILKARQVLAKKPKLQ